MALVIKKWSASDEPNEEGTYVHLAGREAGLLAWALSILGLDPTTEVEIKKDLIVFTSSSLAGRTTRVIPMKSLTSAYYGYEKPWRDALILTILLSPIGIGLILGPLYYWLNKQLMIGVVEASGWTGGFAFKRSVIEGVNIDEEQAYEVIKIVRTLIEKA